MLTESTQLSVAPRPGAPKVGAAHGLTEQECSAAPPEPGFKAELFRRLISAESFVRLDVMEDLSRTLCSTLEVDQIFDVLADRLRKLVEHSHLSLALYCEARAAYVVECTAAHDGFPQVPVGTLLRPPAYGLPIPAEFEAIVYQEDTARDGLGGPLSWPSHGVRSRVFAPLVIDGDCLGTLVLGDTEPRQFAGEETEFLESVARYLAIALRNAMLYRRSREALEQLRSAQHQLVQAEKQREIGEMTAGIAHDLNNSLGGIVGLADLAAAQATDGDLCDLLGKLQTAALEAARTVERVNLFGRQRPGPEENVAINLRSLAEGTITLTRFKWRNLAQMEGRKIEVETQFDDAAPVAGKPNELREVVTNLIMNAVDAMPEGGTVTLRTFRDGERCCLSVGDTGTGIDPAVLGRVFESHFTTKGELGSGVGLSLSRSIAQAHGGSLEVESVAGEGAVFTLSLPLRHADQIQPDSLPERRVRRAKGRALRVLVIEDDVNIQQLIALLLEEDGHHVSTTASGTEGIDLFASQRHDLVMTDYGLPGGTGEAVARAVRDLSPNTPLVLMSGWRGDLNEAQPSEWGVTHVLAKPLDLQALRGILTSIASPTQD